MLQYIRGISRWDPTPTTTLLHGADRFLASQEIPRILWNAKVHHRNLFVN